MEPIKTVKPFVKIRTESVADQLAGKSKGEELEEFGFSGPGRRGPGGGGFGPGNFLGGTFLAALDSNKDQAISHAEFTAGFASWFKSWNASKSGSLTDEELRAGINQDLSPFRNGPPPGFGPPGEDRDR